MKRYQPKRKGVRLGLAGGKSLSLSPIELVYLHGNCMVEIVPYFNQSERYKYNRALYVGSDKQFNNSEIWKRLKD